MNPRGKKLEPKLHLEMPFDEALSRFARVTPAELNEAIEKSKQATGRDNHEPPAPKPKKRKSQTPG